MSKYRTDFVVEGSGSFPFDMLRYDCAFPAIESEKNGVHGSGGLEHHRMELRKVRLSRYHRYREPGLTPDRWKSFGWRIIEVIETVKL